MQNIISSYKRFKNQNLKGRYFNYDKVESEIKKLTNPVFEIQQLGYSVQRRPIYKISFGIGNFKILIWSQMHGNESTSTKAIFDLLNLIQDTDYTVLDYFKHVTVHIIPVLNPDGLEAYTRVNANEVDLNRDALECSQPESKILRRCVESIQPDFCFNMHGQRTIFSAGFETKPATLSFLSPSINEERAVTSVRKKVMQLIVGINEGLQVHIPQQIGRYDDAFNINCTGDYYQSNKIPVILFESGHYKDDYQREKVREFTFYALIKGIEILATNQLNNFNYKSYFEIPQNQKLYFDVIVRNVNINDKIISLGILYEEQLESEHIKFVPKISEVGDLTNFFGHIEIDANKDLIYYKDTIVNKKPDIQTIFEVDKVKLNRLSE